MTSAARTGQNFWLDSGEDFMGATWFWPSRVPAGSTAVVIVPGIVHEERTMLSGLVALAESLADKGLPSLLVDLHGTSQSAGAISDTAIDERWRTNIRSAVQHAKSIGAARVIVVGVRLGVPLAVEALADEPLAALVAWAPIVSGRRYVRELKLLERTTDEEAAAAGTIAVGGFSIPATVLEYVSRLDLGKIDSLKASRVMLREMSENLDAPWLGRLIEFGVAVEKQESREIQSWLFAAEDQPGLPHEEVRELAQWCLSVHDQTAMDTESAPVRPAIRPVIEFVHEGNRIRETFLEIGPSGLTAVLSEPAGETSDHPVRLLMSTVGPGRTFADFARDEASRGNSSLRFDFAGFGTSGRGEVPQGGELYTERGAQDVEAVVEYLRQAGHSQVYGLGFCAGAWSMMQADVVPELSAVVAINVALYRQPGPVMPDGARRAGRRLSRFLPTFVRTPLKKLIAGMRRAASERREPVEWLIRLCSSDSRVLLAYADLDLGLNYLNGQMAKGLREQLSRPFLLRTYSGLGHLAEGPAARTRVFRDIADFFARLDAEPQGGIEQTA